MTAVDTSVWIDWFADRPTPQASLLDRLVQERQVIIVFDLVLMEVLQGARDERHAQDLLTQLATASVIAAVHPAIAIAAARHHRTLRARGVTIRKTVDTLIATRCIADGVPLLYSDRDFDPFVEHLGLRSALDPQSGAS